MTAGLDTCSIAFRPATERFFDQLLAKRHRTAGGGGVVFDEKGPGGTRLGAFPSHGVVWWEGRVDALLTGSALSWDLRPKSDLHQAEDAARRTLERLADCCIAPAEGDSDGELRRYDLASEVEFDDPRDGLAFLKACASLSPPNRVTDVVARDGRVQTVYYRTPKRFVVTERIYDKGRESGSHDPGLRIRIEAQRRPQRSKRRRPGVVARMDLTADFGRTMNPYLGAENVIAAGTNGAVDHLAGMATRGELGIAKAERLIGTVMVLREYGRAFYPDEQQQQRRLRDLRGSGVVLEDELPADRVVPVAQLLRESVERFSA